MGVGRVLDAVRRRWPQARAAFVSFHLAAIVLSAVPAPVGGMNRRNWRDPTVQGELRVWADRLGVEPARLEDRVFSFARGYMRARELWLAPVEPYLDLTGTGQPWRMFVAPHRYPARFRVEAAGAGGEGWETLFEERSAGARWHAPFFEQERVRSILFRYAWPEYSASAGRFCEWLADRVFEERPDIERVRCRYAKARSPSPEEARAGVEPPSTWVQTRTVTRRRAPEPAVPRGARVRFGAPPPEGER